MRSVLRLDLRALHVGTAQLRMHAWLQGLRAAIGNSNARCVLDETAKIVVLANGEEGNALQHSWPSGGRCRGTELGAVSRTSPAAGLPPLLSSACTCSLPILPTHIACNPTPGLAWHRRGARCGAGSPAQGRAWGEPAGAQVALQVSSCVGLWRAVQSLFARCSLEGFAEAGTSSLGPVWLAADPRLPLTPSLLNIRWV